MKIDGQLSFCPLPFQTSIRIEKEGSLFRLQHVNVIHNEIQQQLTISNQCHLNTFKRADVGQEGEGVKCRLQT